MQSCCCHRRFCSPHALLLPRRCHRAAGARALFRAAGGPAHHALCGRRVRPAEHHLGQGQVSARNILDMPICCASGTGPSECRKADLTQWPAQCHLGQGQLSASSIFGPASVSCALRAGANEYCEVSEPPQRAMHFPSPSSVTPTLHAFQVPGLPRFLLQLQAKACPHAPSLLPPIVPPQVPRNVHGQREPAGQVLTLLTSGSC